VQHFRGNRDTSRESDSRAVVLPKANTVIKRQLPAHAELIYIVLVVERIWSAKIKQVYDLSVSDLFLQSVRTKCSYSSMPTWP
jgi:hypothetical protein